MKKCRVRDMIAMIICLYLVMVGYQGNIEIKAIESEKTIEGKLYQFGEKSEYVFDDDQQESNREPYGELKVFGNINSEENEDGIKKFVVKDGQLKIHYIYDDTLLNEKKDKWHIDSDSEDEVNGIKLDGNIKNGVIILQTSLDYKNWYTAKIIRNAFEEVPVRKDSFYSAESIELTNNTYYRVIVAYKMAKREQKGGKMPWQKSKYSYIKYAEKYEFRAEYEDASKLVIDKKNNYSLGEKVRVSSEDGFKGNEEIDKDDPHSKWDLGKFFICGYSDNREDNKGKPIFLKNVGDNVTLYFELLQDIDKCNNNKNIYIDESDGYDNYFDNEKVEKKGTLLIRKTDYQNNKEKIQRYVDFLSAYTSPNANTRISIFEEGDYEIALDYTVRKKKKGAFGQDSLKKDDVQNYRISFEFSIRNGNCAIYPFDVETKEELTNSSCTENGFYIDRANNKYLKYTVKKQVINEGKDGLEKDDRYNKPDSEGTNYTEEGIYVITAENLYTGKSEEKIIYVGTDDFLKACVSADISLNQINELLEKGATVDENGNIQTDETVIEVTKEIESIETSKKNIETSEKNKEIAKEENVKKNNNGVVAIIIIIIIVLVAGVASGITWFVVNKKHIEDSNNEEKK
ncbi:hypothetical protein [uncultured Eubacterium sp.]|uniref:hypothetical protein n=1 Tax=uncultured Eubacterium sp. TaxID=165185 RepID=UPI002597C2FD|nr:hypothetical protein [uncultured Eubacterium sp.]